MQHQMTSIETHLVRRYDPKPMNVVYSMLNSQSGKDVLAKRSLWKYFLEIRLEQLFCSGIPVQVVRFGHYSRNLSVM